MAATASASSPHSWPTANSEWPGPEPKEGDEPPETDPPWRGWIETTGDALLILEAARRGLIPRVTRRLVENERKMIVSGSVFVFDEGESGIKRWTDGYFWSPSRILGNFLLYRQTEKKGGRSAHADRADEGMTLSRPKSAEPDPSTQNLDKSRERSLLGSLTHSAKFKQDGLMKKTFSVNINGVSQHIISYYRVEDVQAGRLPCPSSLAELASLDISPEYLDKAHFRHAPKVEIGPDGIARYSGEADDIEAATQMRPPGPLISGSALPRNARFSPYARPAKNPTSSSPLPQQIAPTYMAPYGPGAYVMPPAYGYPYAPMPGYHMPAYPPPQVLPGSEGIPYPNPLYYSPQQAQWSPVPAAQATNLSPAEGANSATNNAQQAASTPNNQL